jgi:acetyl-CoA synthetase
VLVEMLSDAAHLLLPVSDAEILQALRGLRLWPLLAGFRGRSADLPAVVDAVARIAAFATDLDDRLAELEVNPLLAGPDRAVAADVLVRLAEPGVAA